MSVSQKVDSAPASDATHVGAEAWVAAGLILIAAAAFSLLRVQAVNLPWHLATARVAEATGHWLASNTFSYTFPDYPVYQQYPVFQATVWAVYRAFGWSGLSVTAAVGWVLVFLLFVRWAGPFRRAPRFHVIWMLGLCALQRRMILRPDLFTMIALGVQLGALDAFMRGRTRALVAIPIVHVLWANSHQLFPLSLLVQGLCLGDLVRQRDRRRSVLVALALAASLLLTFATPLGWRIVLAPLRTAQSLSVFRDHVAEFARIWHKPLELSLALVTGIPAVWALWRTRRTTPLFELGLWLMSLALVISAVRGLMFFGIVSVAIFQRCAIRLYAGGETWFPPLGAGVRRTLRGIGFAVTAVIAATAVHYRWVRPPLVLGGTQPGLGRTIGGWAESATDFLRASPPPGRMLNLGAGLGDDVIFWVPGLPVFVDSRLESYPPEFLRDVLAAETSDAALGELIGRFGAQWIFIDHTRPALRDRAAVLVRRGWRPVYADSECLVLVRPSPATQAYLHDHELDLARAQPPDLVAGFPSLREEQRARFGRLAAALANQTQ